MCPGKKLVLHWTHCLNTDLLGQIFSFHFQNLIRGFSLSVLVLVSVFVLTWFRLLGCFVLVLFSESGVGRFGRGQQGSSSCSANSTSCFANLLQKRLLVVVKNHTTFLFYYLDVGVNGSCWLFWFHCWLLAWDKKCFGSSVSIRPWITLGLTVQHNSILSGHFCLPSPCQHITKERVWCLSSQSGMQLWCGRENIPKFLPPPPFFFSSFFSFWKSSITRRKLLVYKSLTRHTLRKSTHTHTHTHCETE